MFGLPAGILSDGFKELAEKRRSKMRVMNSVLERFKTGRSKRHAMRNWFLLSARRLPVGPWLVPRPITRLPCARPQRSSTAPSERGA